MEKVTVCVDVMGGDESKAIAMSVLDHSLRADDVRYPTQDQEFVLYHIDGVEATGFISHLKLPHGHHPGDAVPYQRGGHDPGRLLLAFRRRWKDMGWQ